MNKEEKLEYIKEWRKKNPEKVKEAQRKYLKTTSGRVNRAKADVKRKRELGYNPINEPFEGCAGQHINNTRRGFYTRRIT